MERKAVFTISNATKPDSEIEPARLFERFYRGDKAHSRKVEGVGLGLSIAREIARAHQGDLVLHELRPDFVSFVLTLPTV
jgi:signal transduction histidine kinase